MDLPEFLPYHELAWLLLVSRPYIYVEVDKTKKEFLKLSSTIDLVNGNINNVNCAFCLLRPIPPIMAGRYR